MNATTTDDALAEDLRHRALAAAPAMSLDPTAVLAAGHRHRRRRIALMTSTGALAAAGLCAVAVTLVGATTSPDGSTLGVAGSAGGPAWSSHEAIATDLTDRAGRTAYDLGLSVPAGVLGDAAVDVVVVPREATIESPAHDDPVPAVGLDLWTVLDGELDEQVLATEVALDPDAQGRNLALTDGIGESLVTLVAVHVEDGAAVELVGPDGAATPVPLTDLPDGGDVRIAVVVSKRSVVEQVSVRTVTDGESWSVPVTGHPAGSRTVLEP